jgi:hypothetical protein
MQLGDTSMKLIIEDIDIVQEHDNKVQEEAGNHNVNENSKDKQKDGQQDMELIFVQKKSTDNATQNEKKSLKEDARN